MGIERFSRSKKEYESMQGNVEKAEANARESKETSSESILNRFLYLADRLTEWNQKNMLKGTYNRTHEEANRLNAEYEGLKTNVINAVTALKDFEKNKLGMAE